MSQQKSTDEDFSPNPVIVCNCHYNGLAILQELGHRGIPCIAADCRREIGTFSRYAKFKKVPSPVRDERGFVDAIISIAKELPKKPVIFPTNDEWAMALSRYRDELQEVAIPMVSDFEAIKGVLDKKYFYKVGGKKGYKTPVVLEIDECFKEENKNIFPVAVKPAFRRSSYDKSKGGYEIPIDLRFNVSKTPIELNDFLEKWYQYRDALFISQYVPGMGNRMVTIGMYSDFDHYVRNIFSGRKIRGYPPESGDSVVGKSEPVPEEILKLTLRICSELKLTGILQFEFKQHLETGEYILLDVNPRSWSWEGITPKCGVNLHLAAYQDVTGFKLEEVSDRQHDEIYFGKITEDLINCTLRYKREHPEWHYSVKQWWEFYRSNRVYSAEFHYPDYPVWGVVMVKMLRNLWNALRGK